MGTFLTETFSGSTPEVKPKGLLLKSAWSK